MYPDSSFVIIPFLFFIGWIACLFWIYNDTKKRNKSTVFWVLLTFFTGFIAIIVWLIVRPSKSNKYNETSNKTVKRPLKVNKHFSENHANENKEKKTILKESDILQERMEKLLQKNENLDFSEVTLLRDHPDASQRKKASKLLSNIEKELDEFNQIQKDIEDIKTKSKRLTDRLANGELDSESYKRALDDLEKYRKAKEERLWALRAKLFTESDYEKPF